MNSVLEEELRTGVHALSITVGVFFTVLKVFCSLRV